MISSLMPEGETVLTIDGKPDPHLQPATKGPQMPVPRRQAVA
jgi:hypothetical protein